MLVSAYGCGPGEGSEPGAGWAIVKAAAQHHEVWVLTRSRFEQAISSALSQDALLSRRIHPVYVSLPPRLERAKRRPRDVYWYYALWQRRAGKLARALHDDVHFDVLHHATFASDWLPCGLTAVDEVPLVWGPVGGSTYAPVRLLTWLGARGAASEVLRAAGTRVARRFWGDRAARRASLVVGLNKDVTRRFSYAERTVVEPNAAIEAPAATPVVDLGPRDHRVAVFVGRLVAWKGIGLAVRSLAEPAASGWRLDVYGEGPDRGRAEKMAHDAGVADRVTFHGMRPRETVLEAFATADALLFPSMHDSAPWVVAEAVMAGCPVICLDRGGPPAIMEGRGTAVPVTGRVLPGLAEALWGRAGPATPHPRGGRSDRLPSVVASWYQQVSASRDEMTNAPDVRSAGAPAS